MQQVLPFTYSSSVHSMKLLVDEKFDLSGESEDPYYEVTVKSPGYNPRFPFPFEKKVLVINSKLFSRFANKVDAEVSIYADYEKVRWVRLEEQDWVLPDKKRKSWLTLNIGMEPIVTRQGMSDRVFSTMLQEAKF